MADTGGQTPAARALGLTQPTMGRHIDSLAAVAGRPLFVRTPQGLARSVAAAALTPEARAMQLTAESLPHRAASAPAAGVGAVRIAASHVVGAEVLPIALASLLAARPGLAIELARFYDSADLLRRKADLAIRRTAQTQSGLGARRLGPAPIGLFARRNYLDRTGLIARGGSAPSHRRPTPPPTRPETPKQCGQSASSDGSRRVSRS
jgi:DNA-binding transcriptional LysR family regulator